MQISNQVTNDKKVKSVMLIMVSFMLENNEHTNKLLLIFYKCITT